ncbi:MAG: hypothetical protein LBG19_00880 [Prevotellaceae bacterium]|jgi:hypothetical protein|nr:hypothetical protein [Prevotellaceae bacterium]
MTDYSTLLFVVAPALLVALSAYMIIKKMLEGEANRKGAELVMEARKITIPVRLQAYERLVLLLDRISPESLIIRVRKNDMTNQDLQLALLSTIRAEFEHNLAQQLYVGMETWEAVKAAKESIVVLVNEIAMKVKPDEPSIVMARALLEQSASVDMEHFTDAMTRLKSEAKKIF